MPFAIPESYRAYCSDRAVRTAVDHILSAADKKGNLALPSDIEWKDLPAFHTAVLSAHQVRCEFSVMLIEFWDAVWQPALDECGLGSHLNLRTVAETETWSDAKFDTNTVWDNGWFGRYFQIGGTSLELGLAVFVVPEGAKLGLSFWETDAKDHTTGTDFGEGWPEQGIDEGWAYTGDGLAPIGDDGTVDLNPLYRAATDALAAIGNHLQG